MVSGVPETAICVQDIDVQCALQFTLIHAAGCALHRHTSRVIHRLELSVAERQRFRFSPRGKKREEERKTFDERTTLTTTTKNVFNRTRREKKQTNRSGRPANPGSQYGECGIPGQLFKPSRRSFPGLRTQTGTPTDSYNGATRRVACDGGSQSTPRDVGPEPESNTRRRR